ncbi:S-layer homology domain-containing protein [Paenibacillus sp. FA6]|uniref:S-layer homology domain-containing protein n=1 Tax=Paenibacillus sp. FA6 TaxID=3413029 RepID=UPI003F65F2BD
MKMKSVNILTKVRMIPLMVALSMCISSVLFPVAMPSEIHAESATASNRTDFSVSGDRIIWMEQDGDGNKQIYYRNEATKQQKVLTTSKTAKDAPYIKGDRVIWADKGTQDPSTLNWDIYSYDLQSGIQQKLNARTAEYGNPSVDSNGAVWFERKQYGNMIYQDLQTGTEIRLGEGKFPVLANGNVVYRNARDGGLSMLTLSTGVTRSLINLGGSNDVDWFVTNGSYVLWKQKNGSSESKFVVMSLTDLTAQPQDLAPMSVKDVDYSFMSIGDTRAVYMEQVNGQPVVKGVNLTTSSPYTVAGSGPDRQYIGFNGDKLVYSTQDNSFGVINTDGSSSEQPSTGPSDDQASSQPVVTQGTGNKVLSTESAVIGAKGGHVASKDGMAQLNITAGVFTKDSKVSLSQVSIDNRPLRDELGRSMESDNSAWQVETDSRFGQAVQLTLGYKDSTKWRSEHEKLGIYKYDVVHSYWTYIGGITGVKDGFVQASIQEPGIYAVMLREVTFPDISGHWASQSIDVLSSRGIINGMSEDVFVPNGKLTRAQFTKLLVSAMGMEPIFSSSSTFSDVQSKNWSYGWVEAAAAAGIVEGDHGAFHPDAALTREQMMAMMMRAAGSRLQGAEQEGQSSDLTKFIDHASVSAWAKPFVIDAINLKLIEGNGDKLEPLQTSTRAQAATVIYRLMLKLQLL